jgi:hypothetical protein
MTRHSMLFIV